MALYTKERYEYWLSKHVHMQVVQLMIVIQKHSKRYYPTRLATTLTSGKSALAAATVKYNHLAQTNVDQTADGGDDQGFIILETNYKLYAYTGTLTVHTIQSIYMLTAIQIHHFRLLF